ncbi:TrbC/VirB2 family protein [Shewanella khirikhana]|uniref:TrbC/VIRB2 family protein n=1 Tax=Shewanella khirikhana TaxID=1965282 RepID=A0ABM7DXK9_9GAMM|nr:TrbC/VirB2 family protein [Shewanella khirikhana]AZQ13320.1 TrbC/VIRB2 family protein [Shewanella khirikhana]
MNKTHLPGLVTISILLLMMMLPDMAYASSSTGMPWETPLSKIVASITGPVAFGISVLAIAASGATLIWGGEITNLIKTLVFIALVISVILFAVNILSSVFGISSTSI